MQTQTRSLLRTRGGHDSGKVGMVELFFDLVFVFAVTQLSHSLLAHLSLSGAAQIALLLPAVWWVWIYTSWSTNWLNPERIPVRLCLFALMIAGLVLSAVDSGSVRRPWRIVRTRLRRDAGRSDRLRAMGCAQCIGESVSHLSAHLRLVLAQCRVLGRRRVCRA